MLFFWQKGGKNKSTYLSMLLTADYIAMQRRAAALMEACIAEATGLPSARSDNREQTGNRFTRLHVANGIMLVFIHAPTLEQARRTQTILTEALGERGIRAIARPSYHSGDLDTPRETCIAIPYLGNGGAKGLIEKLTPDRMERTGIGRG